MQALHTVLSFLILVSAVGTCLGQANLTCIHTGLVTPVHNFSVENFLGTWHGQKIYTGLAENAKPLEFRCLDIVFSRSESTFLPLIVEERFIENGTDTPTVLPDYVHISEENDAIWKIIGYYEGELLESDSVMVQTDYTNWAIQFGCSV